MPALAALGPSMFEPRLRCADPIAATARQAVRAHQPSLAMVTRRELRLGRPAFARDGHTPRATARQASLRSRWSHAASYGSAGQPSLAMVTRRELRLGRPAFARDGQTPRASARQASLRSRWSKAASYGWQASASFRW